MTIVLLQFLFFAGVIVGAGAALSRYADVIAERTGLGRLVVGSVLLASITSLPELSVDIACVRQGDPDLGVGDLLGSCLMNLLILAVLDLSAKSRGKMFSRTASGHALGGIVSISLASIVAIALIAERQLGGPTLMGLGGGVWLVLAAYLFGIRMIFLDQRIAARVVSDSAKSDIANSDDAHSVGETQSMPSLSTAMAVFVVAAIVILFTGPRLSAVAGELADKSGLAKSFVGTTLVAISTSLPELVTCWAAVRMGAHDLAIGNIFGSNAFNFAILIALDIVQSGSLLAVVSQSHAITAISVMFATSVIIMGQLYHVERRIWFIEPDALLVILIISGCLWLIYAIPM